MKPSLDHAELGRVLHEARTMRHRPGAEFKCLERITAPILIVQPELRCSHEPETAVVRRLAQHNGPSGIQRPARVEPGFDQRRADPTPPVRFEHGNRSEPNAGRAGFSTHRTECDVADHAILINRHHRHSQVTALPQCIHKPRFRVRLKRRGEHCVDGVCVSWFLRANQHRSSSSAARPSRGLPIVRGMHP